MNVLIYEDWDLFSRILDWDWDWDIFAILPLVSTSKK